MNDYEEQVKYVIPSARSCELVTGWFIIQMAVNDIENGMGKPVFIGFKKPIIGMDNTEEGAWKNAYYNLLNFEMPYKEMND